MVLQKKLPVLLTAWLGLFLPGLLAGQATPRDTLKSGADLLFVPVPTVTAASRYSQELADAPASISVITGEEIRRLGYRSLREVLTSVRGIYASYDRNYTYIGIRGFAETGNYNTRILFLLDGHRINEPLSDFVAVGLDALVSVDDIDRVEVVRGPSSSLYGTNAVLGVINIVTRRATGEGVVVHGETGSLGTIRAGTRWDGRVGGATLSLSGTYYRSSGADHYFPELDEDGVGDGRALGLDGETSANFLGKLSLSGLDLVVGAVNREKEVPTASYETTVGQREFTMDRRAFGYASFEHGFTDLSRFTAKASFDLYYYEGDYPYDGAILGDYFDAKWLTLDAQYMRPIGRRHRLVLGGELRTNPGMRVGQRTEWEGDDFDIRRSTEVTGLYAQDELRFGPVLLNVGLRYDYHEGVGGRTTPRAALILRPTQTTSLKLLASQAFRAPNMLEQDYYAAQASKPALRPEQLETLELVGEQALGSAARLTGSLYYLELEDVISIDSETDSDGVHLFYTNQGSFHGYGAEVEMEGRLGGVEGRVSYAYQRLSRRGVEADPPNSPRHIGRIGAVAPLGSRLTLGLELQAVGDRRSLTGERVPGYARANTRLTFDLVPSRVDLILSGSNLLDANYGDPGGEEHRQVTIPQDGRTLRFGLRARL